MHDGQHAVGHPHRLRHARDAVGGDGVGIEHHRIDAARNDPDPRRIDLVLPAYHLGDVMAGGDHDLAFGHDRVVAALERQVLAVNAVIGGDEMRAGALAGEPGGPRRRARAGVHEGDVLGADQRLQSGGVAPDRDRVPGQQRQREVTPAGALHRMNHRAAGAGHQRHALGLGDRLGDFDGAAFHAAGDQGRQHLQHNGRSVRFGRVVHVHAENLAQAGPIADYTRNARRGPAPTPEVNRTFLSIAGETMALSGFHDQA